MNKLFVIVLAAFLSACATVDTGSKKSTTYPAKQVVKDPLIRGLIRAESGWNKNVVSSSGAVGMTQILPATARAECGLSRQELFDSEKNITCGSLYLSKALRIGGAGCSGINLYNTGIYATPRCSGYGRKVLAYAEQERRSPFSTVPQQHKAYVLKKYAYSE